MQRVIVREAIAADEDEGLVTGVARALVGVDGGEIDAVVLGTVEVDDRVMVGADRALADGVEVELVETGAAGQPVAAGAARNDVVADAAGENVVAATAVEEVRPAIANRGLACIR